MKHIKNFEGKYNREVEYKYLNEEDTNLIKDVVITFIKNKEIIKEINSLKLTHFMDYEYDYFEVFNSLLSEVHSKYNNIYFSVDTYVAENKIKCTLPALRNSIGKILKEFLLEEKSRWQCIEETNKTTIFLKITSEPVAKSFPVLLPVIPVVATFRT